MFTILIFKGSLLAVYSCSGLQGHKITQHRYAIEIPKQKRYLRQTHYQ